MKHKILTIAVTMGILLGTSAIAGAQTHNRIKAKISFDFLVGKKSMKGGDYTIKRISQNTAMLQSEDGKSVAIVLAPISLRQREGSPERLVFKRFGSEYLLAEVWTDRRSDGQGLDIAKSAQQLVKIKSVKPETVEVLAKAN